MKYTLKGYQHTAAVEVLKSLEKARRRYREDDEHSAFALTAMTGAGKTVIAAAVLEALLRGAPELDAEADPTAVVLWLTDDASLNNQTRQRMIQASDLDVSQLLPIDDADFPDRLDTGRVYFLNVQKLYDSSVKYTQPSDKRNWSLWDTLANTTNDPNKTLYLVLDEAHKGMKRNPGRASTVQRVINGQRDLPAAPVVWGISATTERFTQAVSEAKGRTTLPDVGVDVSEVHIEGLLKDAIILDNPREAGEFDTVLLRDAVARTREQSDRWAKYCADNGLAPVLPLLVVQVGNAPGQAELTRLAKVITDGWPDLPDDGMANVFGEHADLLLAGRTVRYVLPETVQDDQAIRVLIAKDAVTTGWDCPRAEVLWSARGGQDKVYITQLIGRMVRTPLARRVPAGDLLNSVVCLLPKFNKATTLDVATRLTKGNYDDDGNGGRDADGGGGPAVITEPVVLRRNADVPDDAIALFASLPSEPKPSPLAKPVDRLLALATALAGDGLLQDATAQAMKGLYAVLDGQYAQHRAQVEEQAAAIKRADMSSIGVSLADGALSHALRSLPADVRTVDDAFKGATRNLKREVAVGYQKHRAQRDDDGDGPDLAQARLEVAALAQVPEAVRVLRVEADRLATTWLAQHDARIKLLSDDRTAEYDLLRSQASTPVHRDPRLPDDKVEQAAETDGSPFPTRRLHLLADEHGEFPVGSLLKNTWEKEVLDNELRRDSVVGWYRNPSQATEYAVQIPYRKGDKWSNVQPDLIFFDRKADGTVVASIVDPHGDFLGDALDKLQGIADFAEKHQGRFLRIDSLAKNTAGQMCKLDMTRPDVRDAVRAAAKPADLFDGPLAVRYL